MVEGSFEKKMELEHCAEMDSTLEFDNDGPKVPKDEWERAEMQYWKSQPSKDNSASGRTVGQLMSDRNAELLHEKYAPLMDDEVVAGRLYTGDM